MGDEDGVPYAIWTMEVTTSAKEPGKKWATCEWQQGDFPLSTDFEFLIFRRISNIPTEAGKKVVSYGLGEHLDDKDTTQQIEDEIKRQMSNHYSVPASSVSRSEDGQEFLITVNVVNQLIRKDSFPFILNFLNISTTDPKTWDFR